MNVLLVQLQGHVCTVVKVTTRVAEVLQSPVEQVLRY